MAQRPPLRTPASLEPGVQSARGSSPYEGLLLGTCGIALLLFLWEACSRLEIINPFLSSAPSRAFAAGLDLLASGELWHHFAASALEFLTAFVLAVAVGIPAGFLMGWFRWIEMIAEPYAWFLYTAPLVAFYPLFIAWFGFGMPTVIAISFLLAVFPLMMNTTAGIRNVDPSLIKMAQSFGATHWDIFWRISLPASLPIIAAGLRLAVGRALVGVMVGELFGATAGLGYATRWYASMLMMDYIFAILVVIALFGVAVMQFFRILEQRISEKWRP